MVISLAFYTVKPNFTIKRFANRIVSAQPKYYIKLSRINYLEYGKDKATVQFGITGTLSIYM